MNTIMLERRQFLQAGGALVVAFALTPALSQPAAQGAFPLRGVGDDAVDSFLAIAPDGTVTLYSGRVDLGTGLRASYRQIVAEELDVAYERIVMIDGDTALTPDQGGTGGSTGHRRRRHGGSSGGRHRAPGAAQAGGADGSRCPSSS